MVVACIALVVALGSGAYAAFRLPANSVGTKQLKAHAVTPKKLSRKTINLLKGKQGPMGATGSPGSPGAPGTARAYAYVHGSVTSPTFDSARTKGFSVVSEPQHGVYCLTAPGIDPANVAPAVTAVYNSGFAGTPTAAKLSPNLGCASGQFQVITEDINETYSAGGYVTSVSEASAPNLDFTIVVP
ncbi:MAG: hypothetical protein JOZ73_02720 [Solirubrobacterales bacterium]|nr:hypothetical protein [Solirubrobacterales bacterium]